MKNLLVHTIFHHNMLGSNPISSKFHTCDGLVCMPCMLVGTYGSFNRRFSSNGWYGWVGEENLVDFRFVLKVIIVESLDVSVP